MMRRSGRYEHSVWDTRRYACAAAETVSLNGPGERAVLSCATQCLLRSGRAHGQYAAVTRLEQTARTHRMPKCVLHGKGHGTHGQSELVRYNMQRTAAHGGAGPALTDGWERPLGGAAYASMGLYTRQSMGMGACTPGRFGKRMEGLCFWRQRHSRP